MPNPAQDMVNVIGPGGNVTSVPRDALPAMEARGFRAESGADEAKRVTREVIEADYGGVGGGIQTALEGAARGASFGMSDVLLEGLVDDRDLRLRREVNPGIATGSELAGAIAPGVLSGGSGFVGTVARLSPAGRLAAATARVAAGGTGALERAGMAALSGGIEGVAAGAGNYFSQLVLQEDPAFSAEALASEAARSALFGGLGGAVGGVVGDKAARLRSRLAGEEGGDDLVQRLLGKSSPDAPTLPRSAPDAPGPARRLPGEGEALADDVAASRADQVRALSAGRTPDDVLPSRADQARMLARKVEPGDLPVPSARPARGPVRDEIPVDAVLSRTMRERVGDNVDQLVRHVDDAARRPVSRDLTEILEAPKYKALDDVTRTELRASMSSAIRAQQEAAQAAKGWAQSFVRDAGITAKMPAAEKRLRLAAASIPDELDDSGVALLARLDEANGALEETLRRARQAVELPVDRAPSPWRQLVDAASTMASSGGLLSAIPVIGPALGWFMRARAGMNAVGKIGGFLRTPQTGAAARVTGVRDRIQSTVAGAMRSSARAAAGALASPITAVTLARSAAEIDQIVRELQDQPGVRARAEAAADGADLAIVAQATETAERARAYLLSVAPKNPAGEHPLMSGWRPSAFQILDFQTRLAAVQDPIGAVARILSGEAASLAVEALRAVYPSLFTEVRRELERRQPEIFKSWPESRRVAVGQAFGLPLAIQQLPGYAVPMDAAIASDMQMTPGSPGVASRSPLVTGDQTAAEARRA
jgi:hypothetical protein